MADPFPTPWRTYAIEEMDRFTLEGQSIFVSYDRTCVFVEPRGEPARLADAAKVQELWESHRLVALLAVLRRIQTTGGEAPARSPLDD
jgi:hypothetical protein